MLPECREQVGVVWVPEVSFESSIAVMILIQHNICDGRCISDNPKDVPAFTGNFSPPPSELHFCISRSEQNRRTRLE